MCIHALCIPWEREFPSRRHMAILEIKWQNWQKSIFPDELSGKPPERALLIYSYVSTHSLINCCFCYVLHILFSHCSMLTFRVNVYLFLWVISLARGITCICFPNYRSRLNAALFDDRLYHAKCIKIVCDGSRSCAPASGTTTQDTRKSEVKDVKQSAAYSIFIAHVQCANVCLYVLRTHMPMIDA